jgi:cytochrome c biogenesis protein CcmG, thiol:disulfide interchange protein DsbE
MIQSGGARDPLLVTRPVPKWALALPVLVVIVAVATAVGIISVGRSAKTASVSGGLARVGGTAPAFTSWDLSGNKVSLADFKGRPVLLTFWATWCTACQQELPELQRLRDRYQATGFTVLAVNYKETNNARMSQYIAGLHVNLESVVDPDGAIATAYGVDIGLPINVLLDRKATVLRILIGVPPSGVLETAVGQIVGPTASP